MILIKFCKDYYYICRQTKHRNTSYLELIDVRTNFNTADSSSKYG